MPTSTTSTPATGHKKKKTSMSSEPKTTPQNESVLKDSLWLIAKTYALSLSMAAVLLLLSAIVLAFYFWNKFETFAQTANSTPSEIISTLRTGLKTQPRTSEGHTTFLILGLDQVANRGSQPLLTDTMLLISFDQKSGSLKSISLPRDLWSESYKTKINALYYYGLEQSPKNPTALVIEALTEMTATPIDYTLVITLDEVASMIDLMGGVEVDIPTAFTDHEFPRSDVDIAVETDPEVLYETISFEAGPQRLSGDLALKYIRSRHADGDEGNDIARSRRQQLIIQSLLNQFKDPTQLLDAKLAGNLYGFYIKHFSDSLPPTELIGLAKQAFPYRNQIKLSPAELSIFPDDEQGVIEHPPVKTTQNQWVYAIRDQAAFEDFLDAKLGFDMYTTDYEN